MVESNWHEIAHFNLPELNKEQKADFTHRMMLMFTVIQGELPEGKESAEHSALKKEAIEKGFWND